MKDKFARMSRRLHIYDLDEGYGELLEEVDEELNFEEDDDFDEVKEDNE